MLSGEWLADGMYTVNREGVVQVWCLGCCQHPGADHAPESVCMSMVAAFPEVDGAPAPPADVPVCGNLAQLMAYASAHAGQHAEEQRAAARRRAEEQALADAGAGEPVGSPAGR